MAQADERAKALARLSDDHLVKAYKDALLDPKNLNFSPYLVTSIRELGLWPRLERSLSRS